MQSKLTLAVAAAALAFSMPAVAGESPYNPDHKPIDPALKACEMRINKAMNVLVFMHDDTARGQAINRELQYARRGHEDDKVQDCVDHVSKAEAMEQ